MQILIFLIILTVLVLVHELGHFLVAKFFKIKVEEFGFGFPPRVWGKKIGETFYSVNALPIGGFVKLFGEDAAGGGKFKVESLKVYKDEKRAFYARPWWQKALIITAGVFMNFLLAVMIISSLYAFVGVGVPGNNVVVAQVLKNSPAEKGGLKSGDIIEKINSVNIASTEQLILETKKYLGKEITLKVKEGNTEREIKLTPRLKYPSEQGPMGIAIVQNFENKKYPWYEAPVLGFKRAIDDTLTLIKFGGYLIGQLVSGGKVPANALAGPVGVAQLTGQIIQFGPSAVLFLVYNFSLNLAILNILPIPALDGGRLAFVLFEAVARRKVHPKFESYAHAVGMAILLALIILITIHDITRILSGQSIIPK